MDNWKTITLQQYEQALTDKNMVWTRRAQIINAFRRRLKKFPMMKRREILRGKAH